MSSLEKNLYKRVNVPESRSTEGNNSVAYRGFSTADFTRDGFKLYDLELIKQDIINHFHIRQGEKLSDPKFGTIIWDVLYEPFTANIRNAIIKNVTEIINYDPRVSVNQITVDTYESGIQIQCEIIYLPYNIQEALQFRFDQKAGLLN